MNDTNDKFIFLQAFERLLTQKLQRFRVRETLRLDSETIAELYGVIRETTFDIFGKCSFVLDDRSKEFIAERMFAGLTLNGDEDILREHAISKKTSVRTLPTGDLRTLDGLFALAAVGEEIQEELRRRS